MGHRAPCLRHRVLIPLFGLAAGLCCHPAQAGTFQVADETQLRLAIEAVNRDQGPHFIEFQNPIVLSAALPPVLNSVTFRGRGHALDGDDQFRLLVVGAPTEAPGPRILVNIFDLTLRNGLARGGDGGDGGGGGMGAGAAVLINARADVSFTNVAFTDNRAVGGDGAAGTGGGGGGLGGDGGLASADGGGGGGGMIAAGGAGGADAGGGGGALAAGGAGVALAGGGGGGLAAGGSAGSNGGDGSWDLPWASGPAGSAAGGGAGGVDGGGGGGASGGSAVGGGGGGFAGGDAGSPAGGAGGYLGGGGGAVAGGNGGSGGFGGGGGGAADGAAGSGGYAGGGGGSATGSGGAGGFGGGGGAGASGGSGGFGGGGGAGGGAGSGGGGQGGALGGGGGAGLGGAVFVAEGGGISLGGEIRIQGTNLVAAGNGAGDGQAGAASGAGLFLQGSGNLVLRANLEETRLVEYAGGISDAFGAGLAGARPYERWNVMVTGSDPSILLPLRGNNTYSGDTYILDAGIDVVAPENLGGSSGVLVFDNGTLSMPGDFVLSRDLFVNSGGAILDVNSPGTATLLSDVFGSDGRVVKAGEGNLALLSSNADVGSWEVAAGRLELDADARLGSAALGIFGGGLKFTADIASFRQFTVGDVGGYLDNDGRVVSLSGGLMRQSDPGPLVLDQGRLVFEGDGEFIIGSAGVSGYGNTTIRAGRVTGKLSDSGRLLVEENGTWNLGNGNRRVSLLEGAGTIELGDRRLDVVMLNPLLTDLDAVVPGQSEFSGVIGGTGSLSVGATNVLPPLTPVEAFGAGLRTLVLTGDNTYTGGTRINEGAAVQVMDDAGVGNGPVLLSGGALQHGGDASALDITLDGLGALGTLGNDLAFSGSISGAGTLVKSAPGTLFMNGSGGWSGDTWVYGTESYIAMTSRAALGTGDLYLSTGGGLRLLADTPDLMPVIITGGSGVIDTGIFTARAQGAFSGLAVEDALVKQGSGTLVIAGDSSFTGSLQIMGGTVQYGEGGTTGSLGGAVLVDAGTRLVIDRADTLTLGGVILGNGALVKRGAGLLQLAAANEFSGGLRIEGGFVAADDGSVGTGAVTLAGGGIDLRGNLSRQVTVEAAGGEVLADISGLSLRGNIIGDGQLRKTGAGGLLLEGVAAPLGGVHIEQGYLQVGSGFLGYLASDAQIDDGAELVFGRDDIVSWPGVASGAGALVKRGAGELLLTGDHQHTGLTSVESGILRIGSGGSSGSLAGDLAIAAGATAVFARGDESVFAGTLGGAGNFVQDGLGRLRLTGDNSGFLGTTLVSRGTLVVENVLGGPVDVVAGSLEGTGRITGNVHVFADARFRPGDSLQPLVLDGDLALDPDARWYARVFPDGRVDQATVAGTATLDGDLIVRGSGADFSDGSRYRLLDAGVVTGEFADVDTNFAFYDVELEYGVDFVEMILRRNGITFGNVSLTQNQQAVSSAIETMPDSDTLPSYLLGLSGEETRAALDAFNGDSLLAAVTGPARLSGAFAQTLQRRGARLGLASRGGQAEDQLARFDGRFAALVAGKLPADELFASAANPPPALAPALRPAQAASTVSRVEGVWIEMSQVSTQESASAVVGNPDTEFDATLLSLGFDGYWGDNLVLGAAISQAQGNADYGNRNASADIDGVLLGVYGRWDSAGSLHAKLAFSLGSFDNAMQRTVPVSGVLDSSAPVGAMTASAEAGLSLRLGNWGLRPFGQLQMERALSGAYAESGGSAALQVQEARVERLQFGAGVDVSRPWLLGGTSWAQLQGTVALVQPLGDAQASQDASFLSHNRPFTVRGTPDEATVFALALAGEWYLGRNLALGAGYQLRAGGDYEDQGLLASLNMRW